MAAPAFVHLRLHSEFSIVDGTVRLDDAVRIARDDAMPALALTDLANFFGLVRFYQTAREAGVKPIAGCDVWITHATERDSPWRALLLATGRDGYLRLCDWLSRAYVGHQHRGRAEIDPAWFDEGTDGLIALSGARDGDVGQALLQGNGEAARAAAHRWAARFPGRYYLEVQRAGRPDDDALVDATVALAASESRPAVETGVRLVREVLLQRHPVGHRDVRQVRLAERDRQVAAARDRDRVRERLGQ
ncbi:MAG: PHP domain-containing protein, partial [Burkholderiales bacterium]|nr:PHP domain-containing protein [Burkholderiales bacterium]